MFNTNRHNPAALILLLCRLLALPLGGKLNSQRPGQLAEHLWIGYGLAALIFLQHSVGNKSNWQLNEAALQKVDAVQHGVTGASANPALNVAS